MSTIVTRAGKGSALTHTEVDNNFINLNTDKIEAAQSVTLTNKTISGSNNTLSNIGNSSLTNSSVTIGSTSVSLGSTATTVSGLTLTSPTVNTPTVSGGTINNASVGATTPSTGAFTTLSATGVTTVQAGTVSAPAITTSGDTNTGIFFPAADTVAIGTGGTEALLVNSSQNVGIGTSSPATTLTLGNSKVLSWLNAAGAYNGTTTGTQILKFSDNNLYIDNLDASTSIIFRRTSNAESMRISPSGDVGINTSSPATYAGKLTVLNGYITAAHSTSNSYINWYSGGAALNQKYWRIGTGSGALLFETVNDAYTTATERARITSGGYSKFSNDGSYVSASDSYHEFTNTANLPTLFVRNTNASQTDTNIVMRSTRAANSAYNLLSAESGGGGDIEFRLRGDGNGYADGTWNNNGADYAEFFESATGAALTLGATVVLDGNKVREATDQDHVSAIMGVVRPKEPSKASMVVGNTAWNKWANKYLTDDFDRYIMEDHDVLEWTDEEGKQHSYESHNIPASVTVPDDALVKTHDDKGNKFQHYKINPAWNPDAEYINRENRPEWIIVGLVGQVKILKGQPVNDRWIKMRDVSATVEEWMIR